MNRKLVLFLSLVLSLALATGGTLAYLSDTDADVNTKDGASWTPDASVDLK